MKNNKKQVKKAIKKSFNKEGCDKLVYFEDFGDLLMKKMDEAMDDAIYNSSQYQKNHEWREIVSLESACKIVMKNAEETIGVLKERSFSLPALSE